MKTNPLYDACYNFASTMCITPTFPKVDLSDNSTIKSDSDNSSPGLISGLNPKKYF